MSHSDLTSSLGFGFPQTYFWGDVLLPIFVMRRKYKNEHQTKNVFVKGNPVLRRFICSPLCHTLDWTWRWHVADFFSSPSVQSGGSGPPHIKNPLNRARLRAYTVCSVADRNAGQAVVWLSGYSECCGGG